MSSLEDCLEQKEGNSLQRVEEPGLAELWSPKRNTPRRGRRDTSSKRDLDKVREAHWKALATAATLEEETEQLSQSITWGQSEAHAHYRSWDCHRPRSWGWNRRCCQVQPEQSPAPFFEYSPPWRGPESEEDEEALLDFDLEALPELGPEVNCFLQGLAGSSEEEDRKRS